MFKTILKYAIRNLWKNRVTSILNCIGLSLAVSSLLYIFLYLRFELSYDRFHNEYQRIYNVYLDEIDEGVRNQYATSPMGLGTSLLEDFPEVETMTRTYSIPKSIIKSNDGKEYIDNIIWADSSFFDLFNIKLISEYGSKILNSPNQVCISQQCARKYFSDKNPIGRTLIINDQQYEVRAVFNNYPDNSHLKFDLIGSLLSHTNNRDAGDWDGYMFNTYIKLYNEINPKVFETKLRFIITDRLAPFVAERYKLDVNEWFGRGNSIKLKLMPVSKIHLYASHIDGFDNQNSINNLILNIIASVLILFIACFNFISFNISLFRKNCKTVGIKKLFCSGKYSISLQAFIEAFIIFSVSSVIALNVIYFTHPIINGLLKHAVISLNSIKYAILILFISGVIISFICGYLPSLSHIKKATSILIKSNSKIGKKELTVGQFIFSLQFMISIVILIFLFIINKQVHLINTYDLAFCKENVLIIHRTDRDRDKAKLLADELKRLSGINAVSVTNAYPGGSLPSKDLQLKDSPEGFSYSPSYLCCDLEMINVLKFKLLEGEFFSENSPANSILLNETASRTFGIVKNPIGQTFTRGSGKYIYNVIGVIKDFNFRSLHQSIEPLCIYTGNDYSNSLGASKILVKLNNKEAGTIEAIKQKWNAVYKDAYFEYSFLEDEINALYTKEILISKTIPVFSIIAFVISIIGLIGITYIKTGEKTKEIGIRKVNGAKVLEVMVMLSKDFIKWVAIAFIFACPIAYYAMHKWLQGFAYKTELSWWVFAVAGAVAMAMALLTVSLQSYKAATRNPVEALRYE